MNYLSQTVRWKFQPINQHNYPLMKVLFIYSIQKSVVFGKPLAGQEGIQFGISYISSVLKQNNHSTDLMVIDRKHGRKYQRLITRTIHQFSPDLICLTSVHSEFDFILTIAKYIKSRFPNLPLMGGGVHITLNPSKKLLDVFNCICIGEGEYPVLEYITHLEKGIPATKINNLWIKDNGIVHRNTVRNFIKDLDTLPFPDRSIWQKWILEPQTRITILLGRGCPYNCTYCCNHRLRKIAGGSYVRLRNPDNIVHEIKLLHEEFPAINEYFLEVETIGCDMNWLNDLCEKLFRLNQSIAGKLRFNTNLRISPMMDYNTIFRSLKHANFESVIIGLESGNERVRKEILNRTYSNENILQAVQTARKYDIKIGLFNMVGIPTETPANFTDTVKMNQLIEPDWHSTSIFFPYQGTKLYELTEELGLMPRKLNTNSERQKAVLNLPYFPQKQIQKSFDAFHYQVYKAHKNKKLSKLIIYYIMQFAGHNFFANAKLKLIAVLYRLRLLKIARKLQLFGVFQKA